VSKEYGSYGSILHQPGLCCAGTEACQSQCCFPDVFWLCMAGILGFPYRILTCGKCPFRASWPLACGDPAIFIEFMWHTLLDPIGIKKGMYTAASEEEAKLLAAAEVGSEKKEYVWPRKESPTPVGISTMASLSNVSPYQYTGPLYTWLVKAWNESVEISKKMAKNNDPMVPKRPLEAGQQRQEANPTALVDLNSRDPDLLSADYELQLGEGVKQALDFQWGTTGISEYKEYKFAQPGNALGISVVPFVFTPGSVETKYTAVNKDGSSKVVIPPVGMWMICGGPWCSSMWLKDDVCGWGILGREADFSAVCVKNEDFVLAPDFVPYGHSPGAPHLSPETTIGMGGDAFGIPAVVLPGLCCGLCPCVGSLFCCPLREFDVSLKIRTNPADASETVLFSDGGLLDNTAVTSAVAKGASKVVSILTNISAPYVKDFFNDQRKVIKPELAALFGIVYQEPPAALQYGAIAPPSNGLTPQLCHGLRNTCSYYLNTSATDCFGLGNVVDAGVAPFYLLAHIFDNTAGAFDVDAMLPIVNKLPKSGKPYTRVDLEAMTLYKLLVTQFDDRHKCGKAIAGTLKGLKVLDNPYFGTKKDQKDVDLTVVVLDQPKNWKDEVNANPQLNPGHASGVDLFTQTDLLQLLCCPGHEASFGSTSCFNFKAYKTCCIKTDPFPYYLEAFPVRNYSKPTLNLCGYMGDWIVDDAWDLLKDTFEAPGAPSTSA